MILSEAERDNRINEFLDRKLKEFDLEDEDVPAARSRRAFSTRSVNA